MGSQYAYASRHNSELAKINEITGTIDLSRNDYSYWLQYAQQLILIDEVTLRNQAREIYQNQLGEMKRINL